MAFPHDPGELGHESDRAAPSGLSKSAARYERAAAWQLFVTVLLQRQDEILATLRGSDTPARARAATDFSRFCSAFP